MTREVELKTAIDRAEISRFGAELERTDLAAGPSERQKLETIYFDTPDHALRDAGISLRLRREDQGWLQTVKMGQVVAQGLSNPIELEQHVDGDKPELKSIPDKRVRRAVEKAAGNMELLRPVFETVVERTTRRLMIKGSEVELAIDEGEVRSGSRRRPIREVELELKSGSPQALLVAAETLLPGHRFELSERSKADRGYRLVLDKHGANAEPERAHSVRLSDGQTVAEAFCAIGASASRQIHLNRRALLETEDPEAAHQLRIGLRRLRTAQWALRPWLDRGALSEFEQLARDIGRSVGRLRDADVMIIDLVASAEAAASNMSGFSALDTTLRAHRETIRDDLITHHSQPS